jgi:L-fuculose-phosphate aldolase
MAEKTLVKMRLDGTIIYSGELPPTSEIKMHMRVYTENPEVTGVTHAHPPVCTSFAVAGIALDRAIYPEAFVNLGIVPCVHYEKPGSQGVPDSIAPYCRDYNALLLGNHGALSWGRTLTEAFYRLEAMEHYAMILMYTGSFLKKANMLSKSQIEELVEIKESLGITSGGIPAGAEHAENLIDVIYNP